MTGYIRTCRCCVCGFRVGDHYVGQRFIPCVQLLERHREFSFPEPKLTARELDALDQDVKACRTRIAVALSAHGSRS